MGIIHRGWVMTFRDGWHRGMHAAGYASAQAALVWTFWTAFVLGIIMMVTAWAVL